jgi:hypothetical protein
MYKKQNNTSRQAGREKKGEGHFCITKHFIEILHCGFLLSDAGRVFSAFPASWKCFLTIGENIVWQYNLSFDKQQIEESFRRIELLV